MSQCRRCHRPLKLQVPNLDVRPLRVRFPDTPSDGSSSATVDLRNLSTNPILVFDINLRGNRTNFGLAPQAPFTILVNQTVPLDITFRPLTPGLKTAILDIVSTGAIITSVELSGTGI